jgi:hypothetical protein
MAVELTGLALEEIVNLLLADDSHVSGRNCTSCRRVNAQCVLARTNFILRDPATSRQTRKLAKNLAVAASDNRGDTMIQLPRPTMKQTTEVRKGETP